MHLIAYKEYCRCTHYAVKDSLKERYKTIESLYQGEFLGRKSLSSYELIKDEMDEAPF